MPKITLEFTLSDEAAAHLVAGQTGNDDDVFLSIEKAVACILDVPYGRDEGVELTSDLDSLTNLLSRGLMRCGYTGPSLDRLIGDFDP